MQDDKSSKREPQKGFASQKEDSAAERAEELLESSPELKALPKEVREKVLRDVLIRAEYFQGPLPHPAILKGYEEVLPGSAERIIKLSERQQQHRMDMERVRLYADIWIERLGLGAGFVLAIILAVGGIWLASEGKETTGLAVLAANIAVVVGAFFYAHRRHSKRYQRRYREPPLPPGNSE